MYLLSIQLILASFGGGVFGAALGAIGAFGFCGVFVLVGIAAAYSGNENIMNMLAFGPYFGPHISFAAAVAATGYAGKKKLLDGCKGILIPLHKFKRLDVLLVGGIFGVIGYVVNALLVEITLPIDTIALTVVISNILARVLFGKSFLFTYSMKEKEIKPNLSTLPYNLLLGFSVGLISAFATEVSGYIAIGYGVSAFTLILLFYDEFPVTHHVSICAAYASVATGSIFIGGIFGMFGIIVGEIFGNLFNLNSDTYIDPPALTIALLSAIVFIFLQ